MELSYHYHPIPNCAKYIKWFDDHEDDMDYRYNKRGKQIYTKQELIEMGELNKVFQQSNSSNKE